MTPDDLPPSFQRSSLEGKVAVVTGSTQGLGEATARLFRERGCKGLVLTGRSMERGKILATELTDDCCHAVFVRADLEDLDEVRSIFRVADMTFGTVHILVNAAATTERGSLWDTTPEDYDRIMNVNTRAPFFLMQDATRIMEREKVSGSIINISSTASYGSMPMITAYGMSKGALNVATKNAAYSLMWSKIRVNALAIGWMDTPGEDSIQRRLHCDSEDNWKEEGEANQPFGRLLQPEEVARCIAFCASEESGMMTGCVIDFDQSVWGAGNAPVPPRKEEWAKAHGMTFSFRSSPKASPKTSRRQSTEGRKGSKKSTPKSTPRSSPKVPSKISPKESKDELKGSKKSSSKSSPRSSPKASPKTSPKESKDELKGSKKTTPKSTPRSSPKASPKTSPKESKNKLKGSKKSSSKSSPKSSPKTSRKSRSKSPKSPGNSPKTTHRLLSDRKIKKGGRKPPPPPLAPSIPDIAAKKPDDDTKNETKILEEVNIKEEKMLAKIVPPLFRKPELPKISKKEDPTEVPFPDEARIVILPEAGDGTILVGSIPGTDPYAMFARSQKQADAAKNKYGSNGSGSNNRDEVEYLPPSLSPKPPRPKILISPSSSPNSAQRKLQDAGESIRPDEFFSENNPHAKKKERNNKKPLSRSSDHGDYRAKRVDDWLGGDAGKIQRRSYKVKRVRDLSDL